MEISTIVLEIDKIGPVLLIFLQPYKHIEGEN